RKMPRQLHPAIRHNPHSLIASERLEKTAVKIKAPVSQTNNIRQPIAKPVRAIWREPHDFAFIAILRVADELANHGIKTAQRIRQEHTIEHFNLVPFATRHHRGNKISRPVVTEAGSLLPRRAIISAGNMSNVMLEMMFLETQRLRIDIERLRHERTHIAQQLLALSQTNEVQNFRGITQSIPNFPRKVGIAVLADRHMINIGNLCPSEIQASFDRKRRKSREVLDAIEALFGNGEDDLAVLHQRRRGVRVKHVESQNQHSEAAENSMLHLILGGAALSSAAVSSLFLVRL